MKTFAVGTSYISICFYCYVIAQQLPSHTYAVAMSLYQITKSVIAAATIFTARITVIKPTAIIITGKWPSPPLDTLCTEK